MPRYNNTQWPRQRTPIGPTTESFRSHKAILERNKLNDSWSTRGSHVLIIREVVAHRIDMLPAHFTWSQNQEDLLYLRFAPNWMCTEPEHKCTISTNEQGERHCTRTPQLIWRWPMQIVSWIIWVVGTPCCLPEILQTMIQSCEACIQPQKCRKPAARLTIRWRRVACNNAIGRKTLVASDLIKKRPTDERYSWFIHTLFQNKRQDVMGTIWRKSYHRPTKFSTASDQWPFKTPCYEQFPHE
jgi:hypothetical protein